MARHALIIGINKYPNLAHLGNYDLYGCVNDARLMKRVLQDKFQFTDDEVTELHNEQATRDGIMAQMNRLVDAAKEDDIVIFHYSGHGSHRSSKKEGAADDSTIMPNDSGRDPKPNRDISDKEFNAWLGRLTRKTRYVTMIFDCCHSGTMTRDVFGDAVRAAPPDKRSVTAMDLPETPADTRDIDSEKLSEAGWLEISDSYVVVSGCRDNELSHEFPKQDPDNRNGALTHFFTEALTRATPGTTYRDAFEYARGRINAKWSDQNPQIDGKLDREIFGVKDIEPIRYVAVKSVDGDKVVLNGGKAHGLYPNSQWTVYPPGTKSTDGVDSLAVLEIEKVGALTSSAVVRETHGEVVPMSRCVETATAAEKFQLGIDLSALPEAQRTALAGGIEESKLLTSDAVDNALRVYVLEPRSSAGPDDPVPQVEKVDTPTFAVVDNGGQLTMPLHPVAEDGIAKTLVSNFETIARYRNALALDNADSKLDVEFNLYREVDGKWELANGGNSVFTEGERLSIEVINNESKPIHFCILDFELTRAISGFYPQSLTSEMLAAGKKLELGREENVTAYMNPKEEYPEDRGVETLKIFVTTDESDFRWLQQGATRDVGLSALQKEFMAAYGGPATRAVKIEKKKASDDWKSINRSFHIKRRLV